MSFRFQTGEAVEHGIKRMAREQIDAAVTEIDTQNLSYHERIHQVRKRCKKLRALARLVRPELGKDYRRINRRFRDIGRLVADLRDAQSLVEIHDDLAASRASETEPALMRTMRAALVARRDERTAGTGAGDRLLQAREALLAARADVDTWPIGARGFGAVAGGLRKTYKRGRRAQARAAADPTGERYHDWRKRAKYLRFGVRVLRPIWPELMRPLRGELRRLSDLLGDDHDLHVLRETIAAEPALAAHDPAGAYRDLIDRQQRELRAEAAVLGRRLHVEKAKRFVRRLAAYDHAAPALA